MPKKAKWNEQPCPACKEPCAIDASRCPHCQTDFSEEQIAARKGNARASYVGCGILALIVFVAVWACSPDEPEPLALADAGFGEVQLDQVQTPEDRLSGPQQNAVRSARQYLNLGGFSRNGLIQQLSSDAGDGYEEADAIAAVDSLNVDWNEQAVRSARQYLDMTGFSCNGLIEQLSSSSGDDFTSAQATHGAQQAGAC